MPSRFDSLCWSAPGRREYFREPIPDLPTPPPIVLPQHTRHERRFADNRFVYPVISRRSQGLSLGVNLNPDKICNFDCIYCVDRTRQAETRFVATAELLAELDEMLAAATSGSIFESPELADTRPPGDG